MKKLLVGVELFLAGGFASVLMIRNLLESGLQVLLTVEAQAERLNVLDKLVPFYFGYALALLVVGALTVVVWVWPARGKTKPRDSQASA